MSAATPLDGPYGFIGLGNIGAPMATRLATRDGGLIVRDLRDDVVATLVAAGAAAATSTGDVGRRCAGVHVHSARPLAAAADIVADSPFGCLNLTLQDW